MENSASSEDFFWFLDENSHLSGASSEFSADYEEEDDEAQGSVKTEENKAFWDSQHHLLQATLCRTTSIESRVREATKEALIDSDFSCACRRSGVCRICLRSEVLHRLSSAGYKSSLRKSKWTSSADIPSGEHTYIEVLDKEKGVRVIVELNFRAEFEMARAGDDYDRLVNRLPEVFVGKPDRLRNLVKILCGAGKRCMKQNNIYMPPWRKHKYMLAKWLSSSYTTDVAAVPTPESPVGELSGGRPARPRASLLTFALLERMPQISCQAVAVV